MLSSLQNIVVFREFFHQTRTGERDQSKGQNLKQKNKVRGRLCLDHFRR